MMMKKKNKKTKQNIIITKGEREGEKILMLSKDLK